MQAIEIRRDRSITRGDLCSNKRAVVNRRTEVKYRIRKTAMIWKSGDEDRLCGESTRFKASDIFNRWVFNGEILSSFYVVAPSLLTTFDKY